MLPAANCIRHTHPGLAPLEQPQFPDFGQSQGLKFMRGGGLARRRTAAPALGGG
jgi:hypothetical protein